LPYYWHQVGWNAGNLNTAVKRVSSTALTLIDESTIAYSENFQRDPLDTPLLLDETRKIVFAKNKIFDATDLKKVIHTLPGSYNVSGGAAENAYALDSTCGLVATRNYVYELDRYEILTHTLNSGADEMFFDSNGSLWFVVGSE
jgi:hypothetical protein